MLIWHLMATSLWRERRLFGLWLASLSLAIFGLLTVDVYRQSLAQTLSLKGRKILGADVTLSARRRLSADELQIWHEVLPPHSHHTEMTEMLAMVSPPSSSAQSSRLGAIRFIEDNYPLIGDLNIASQTGEARNRLGLELNVRPLAWVAPDWLTVLGVKIGDPLQIGQIEFAIAGVVRTDSSQTLRFTGFAPRIYVHRRFLNDTGLVQFGSTVTETALAALPPELKVDKFAVESRLADPALEVTTPQDLEQGSLRVLSRLLDYLGLSGLVTLCLGWVAVYYLGRRWLSLESSSIGMLKGLGLSARELRRLLVGKLILIMLGGVAIGGLLAWCTALALLPMVTESLPTEFTLHWSWASTLLLLWLGPVIGLLLLWPEIRTLSGAQPLRLLQGEVQARTNMRDLVVFVGITAMLFVLLTLVEAHSWKVTLIFLAALALSVGFIAGLAYGALALVARGPASKRGWRWHLSLALWTRRKGFAVLMITVSAMAGLLCELVPNLERTLVGELSQPVSGDRPGLFLFDIQDEQLPELKSFLASEHIEISQTAPFIRGRILKLNDENFERVVTGKWSTREDEMDARFRNRGINLSYRDSLSPSEKIWSGKTWDQMSTNQESLEISIETGYAERLKIKLGDILTLDVQGLELRARVANLRLVDWNSFEPNFFILFPNGILNDAPKTWILTVKRNVHWTPVEMQTLVARRFPSVTSVNVQATVDGISDLLLKLGAGLRWTSGLCLALGLFVFLMILMFQMASSQKDGLQLKILGVNRRQWLSLQLITYGGLCALGLGLGALISLVVAELLAQFAFSTHLQVNLAAMLAIALLALLGAGLGMAGLAHFYNRKASLGLLLGD